MIGNRVPSAALAVLIFAFCATAAWAQPAKADDPQVVSSATVSAQSTPAERDRFLQALVERIEDEGFAALRGELEALIERSDLPPAFRSRVFRQAVEAARREGAPEFQETAGRAFAALVEQVADPNERSALLQTQGNVEVDRGRFADAEDLFIESDRLSSGRTLGERANLMTALGVARAQQGKLDLALEAMLEAYARYEETAGGPSPNLLRNIGALSIYLEDFPRAVDFSREAIEALGPDHPETPSAYSNLAAALLGLEQPTEAMVALETGISLAEKQGRPNASLTSNLGFMQREQGELEAALATFERTAELNRANADPGAQAITSKNIGDVLVALDRREEAAEAFERSLALYREADIKPKRLELYPPLVDNLEALGRYPEALARMREWRELAEELASSDAQARIAELQTAFDLERRERELAESERLRLEREAELAALQGERDRQSQVRWGLTLGVGVLLLFLVLLLRTLRLRTRAHRMLAEKNAEIDVQREALTRANALLHRYSNEDELTGLSNRRFVRNLLAAELPRTLRSAPALLILIDLDHFKAVNDRHGHPVGDQVLVEFVEMLRAVAAPEDVLARWGGEEFLWLAAGRTMDEIDECCRQLADRVRDRVFEVDGVGIQLTISMGVAGLSFGDAPQAEFDIAVKIADAALYEAKVAGRNRWVGFDRRSASGDVFSGPLYIPALVEDGVLVRVSGS
jgi:diguanylate cyclase (GGDEF)-like protein